MPTVERFRNPARALTMLFAILATAPALAQQDPNHVGTYRNWSVFTLQEAAGRACFMASKPTKTEPGNVKRGEVYVTITHRPGEKVFDEVSFVAGYTFKPNSEVTVQVGNQTFTLFTDGDTAWARDESTDKGLAQAIRGGASMVVKGTSNRGTNTTDTYSLTGTGQAYGELNKACNVRR
ncbi:MAG TPA: invasion associated locus B family protein [Azospirillaceae bacterium]|nr:invasion associated locus B family protein [Azospirillaceae bacterium]